MSNLPPRPSLRASLGRLWRLTRKELYECLRDRRTVLTLLLMPVLLYLALGLAFSQMSQYKRVELEWPTFTVGLPAKEKDGQVVWTEEAEWVARHWKFIGEEGRLRRHTLPGLEPAPESPPAFLETAPRLEPVAVLDVEVAVQERKVDAGVRLKSRSPFVAKPLQFNFLDCEVLYLQDSVKGHDAVRQLELVTADLNAALISQAVKMPRGDPVQVRAVALADKSRRGSSMVPVLVPLILILMTMTGAVYPAIDLTAGERERGTLEILMAAPIPRMSLLLAKYFAVVTVAMLTALINLGSMTLTLHLTGLRRQVFGESLGVGALVEVFLLLLLFASFFSAVLLTVTCFARSFKEAQAYLIPLMLVSLIPGAAALIVPSLNLVTAFVPLVNIVLLARDVFTGTAGPGMAAIVVASTLAYALAAIAVASRIFGTEAVLAGESSPLGGLFRKAARESFSNR